MMTITSKLVLQTAKTIWYAESQQIKNTNWKSPLVQQTMFYKAKLAYQQVEASIEKLQNLPQDEKTEELHAQYEQAYLKLIALVLSKSKSTDFRIAHLDETSKEMEKQWTRIQEELQDTDTEDEWDEAARETLADINDSIDFVVSLASIRVAYKEKLMNNAANQIAMEEFGKPLGELPEQKQITVMDEVIESGIGPSKFTKAVRIFGIIGLCVTVGIALWTIVDSKENWTREAIKQISAISGISAGTYLGEEMIAPALLSMLDIEADTAIALGVTTGIGALIATGVAGLVDLFFILFWGNHQQIPKNLTVAFTIPLEDSLYTKLSFPLSLPLTNP